MLPRSRFVWIGMYRSTSRKADEVEGFRDYIKAHFESNPQFRSLLNMEYAIVGIGLGASIIGGLITILTYGGAYMFGTILGAVGFWLLLLGAAVAFIKKDDTVVFVSFVVMAAYYLIEFIIVASRYSSSWFAPYDTLIYAIAFGGLAWLSYYYSEKAVRNRQMKMRYDATMYQGAPGQYGVPQQPYGGQQGNMGYQQMSTCAFCGSQVEVGSSFCISCGQRVVAVQQPSTTVPPQPQQPVQTAVPVGPAVQTAPNFGTAPVPDDAGAQAVPMTAESVAADISAKPETVATAAAVSSDESASAGGSVVPADPAAFDPAGQQRPSGTAFCPQCGFGNSSGSSFCEQCGAKVV